MNGTITKRARISGQKPSWGYVFDTGRDETGKRLQSTKSGFETKKEASDALRQAIIEFEAKRDASPLPDLPTFEVFFKRWMVEHASRKCAPKTVERYYELGAYAIRESIEVAGEPQKFGELTLDKFRPMQMQSMLNALCDRGGEKSEKHPAGRPLSPKTVRNIAGVVHGCFERAVAWELIPRNPMGGLALPELVNKTPRIVEKAGVEKLIARVRGTRLFPLILLDLATGARRGELLALQWPDLDFETGMMTLSKSLEQTRAGLRVKSTKSKKPRRFAVPPVALDALREHRIQQDNDRAMFGVDYQENDLVFCRPEGAYYSPVSVGCRVARFMKQSGLEGVSLHSLRHTHASELLSKGVPIPTVAKRLGHANANITLAIYSHAIEADELAAAKIWNDAMADVIAPKKPEPDGMLANVSAKSPKKLAIVAKKAS